MKNVASLKNSTNNSPKTPGGISKSLLTPCRRVGLSRNWKKSGPSPFISPLASNADGNQDKSEERSSAASPNIDVANSDINVDKTPSRNVALPRKRKSKTLLASISSSESNIDFQAEDSSTGNYDKLTINSDVPNISEESVVEKVEVTEVSTPVRVKSLSKSKKKLSQIKTASQASNTIIDNSKENNYTKNNEVEGHVSRDLRLKSTEKSPNELKKECVVVIQRNIFKDENKKQEESIENTNTRAKEQPQTTSQTLFDSDSDDMPLCQINKTGSQNSQTKGKEVIEKVEDEILDEDDFIEHKSKIRKLDTPGNKVKQKNDKRKKLETIKPKIDSITHKPESFDDDEDFDFDNKRTILIRKTYDKVSKPFKSKSTGSITQKDIDELKARIEVKKKLLLAKTQIEHTELRDLIKKWQKGCQDALMELMDLMKKKFPEKSNMDYSEILASLCIPPSLVGYDSENDCFNTPEDARIILSNVDNL